MQLTPPLFRQLCQAVCSATDLVVPWPTAQIEPPVVIVSATAAQVRLPVATILQLGLLQLDNASRWLRAPSVVPANATALPVVGSKAIANWADTELAPTKASEATKISRHRFMDGTIPLESACPKDSPTSTTELGRGIADRLFQSLLPTETSFGFVSLDLLAYCHQRRLNDTKLPEGISGYAATLMGDFLDKLQAGRFEMIVKRVYGTIR